MMIPVSLHKSERDEDLNRFWVRHNFIGGVGGPAFSVGDRIGVWVRDD